MTASLPLPNQGEPEDPVDGDGAPIVRLPATSSPRPSGPGAGTARAPRKKRKKPARPTAPDAATPDPAGSDDTMSEAAAPDASAPDAGADLPPHPGPPPLPVDPGPPPPLPADLLDGEIVVPPRPPLPPVANADADAAEGASPVEEALAEEALVEEALAEEALAEESPAQEALAEEAPAQDATAAGRAATLLLDEIVPTPPLVPEGADDVLVLRGVSKSFGSTKAVDAIDLTVPAGTFYGLVGPNGAGKTTTLSMIAGLLDPTRGSIRVGGVDAASDPRGAKNLIGVLPDRLRTFDRLTGRQLLHYYGVLRGLRPAVVESRTADLARAFDLTDALGRAVSDYSAGMVKKVMLAGALIHSPRLLVLDEPFEAVDPVSSAIILDILSTYVAHGGTVILSSHGMDLVERVCSRVAVIVAGQVLVEGTVDEVRGELTLEQRFVELAGGLSDVEGLEWLHTFSG